MLLVVDVIFQNIHSSLHRNVNVLNDESFNFFPYFLFACIYGEIFVFHFILPFFHMTFIDIQFGFRQLTEMFWMECSRVNCYFSLVNIEQNWKRSNWNMGKTTTKQNNKKNWNVDINVKRNNKNLVLVKNWKQNIWFDTY